jgi:hypothetical protein
VSFELNPWRPNLIPSDIPIPAVQPSSLRINGSYAGALRDPIRSEKSQ